MNPWNLQNQKVNTVDLIAILLRGKREATNLLSVDSKTGFIYIPNYRLN